MARRSLPPQLVPRQPKTELGWAMQKLRQVHEVRVREVAGEFGCSPSHISRVESGDTKPSLALVEFYEERFEADGLLLSLYQVVSHAGEQKRQRAARSTRPQPRSRPGDATAYVDETIPHGSLMTPGEVFAKTWLIKNAGAVPWRDRQLERQGPLTGPGLITSPRYISIPDTLAGSVASIGVILKAPTYDCTSIAYFKMVDSDGLLCFPDEHQLGLDVVVRVERNTGGMQ